MKKLGLGLFIPVLLAACQSGNQSDYSSRNVGGISYTNYAKGFEVIEEESFKLLQVFDPWQNSRNVTLSYILTEDPASVPDTLKGIPVIQVPVQRVIALSTTHVAMIHQLGAAASIKGVSGARLIFNDQIRQRIGRGEVMDVGYDQELNLETIVQLDPDVLFIYGVEHGMSAVTGKLAEMGVPVVYCGEYLEKHPLGKAEWIRFFGLFYGLEEAAGQFFHQIDSTYLSLASQAMKPTRRPRVLTGLPWKGTWYMAGGNSFAARLIGDAGGDYLWKDDDSDEAVPLSLESVYARAMEADIWINPGEAATIDQLIRFDERFKDLPVVKSGEVYSNDLRTGPGGGNDYWESGTVRPDLVLADLIRVFHPDLLTDHQFIYYRKLK
jgi:iron complex transport system substrate-binding protein